jgi:RNA polymerase sigma factor for flagellar operon FliA
MTYRTTVQRNQRLHGRETTTKSSGKPQPSLDREKTYQQYLPRIRLIARRISDRIPPGSSITLDDLKSCGAIGLLEAIERYEPERDILFSTFADYRIRGAMIDALRAADEMSRYRREKAKELEATQLALAHKLHRKAKDHEVAEALNLPLEQYHKLQSNLRNITHVSLDSREDGGDDSRSLLETIANVSSDDPVLTLLSREMHQQVRDAIDELPDRSRECVLLYYGRNLTLAEIAAVYELTPSRISQILRSARIELKQSLQSVALANHLSDLG